MGYNTYTVSCIGVVIHLRYAYLEMFVVLILVWDHEHFALMPVYVSEPHLITIVVDLYHILLLCIKMIKNT